MSGMTDAQIDKLIAEFQQRREEFNQGPTLDKDKDEFRQKVRQVEAEVEAGPGNALQKLTEKKRRIDELMPNPVESYPTSVL